MRDAQALVDQRRRDSVRPPRLLHTEQPSRTIAACRLGGVDRVKLMQKHTGALHAQTDVHRVARRHIAADPAVPVTVALVDSIDDMKDWLLRGGRFGKRHSRRQRA